MNLIFFEAFVVGLISLVIFVFINYIPCSFFIKLFLVGFIKHYFNYLSGLQSFYCDLYLSNMENNKYEVKSTSILIESLLEGFIYIYIGLLISKVIKNNYIMIFTLGFIIHILSEFYGIHSIFLKNNCKIKK